MVKRVFDFVSSLTRLLHEKEVVMPQGVKEFFKNLIDVARFRNRPVHLYWIVDKKEIYEILQDNLSDFEKFLQYLGKLSAKRLDNRFHV